MTNSKLENMITEFSACLDITFSLVKKSVIASAKNKINFEVKISEELEEMILRLKGIWYNVNITSNISPHKWFSICMSYNETNHLILMALNGKTMFEKQDRINL